MLSLFYLARPIMNTAKLNDVCITEFYKLFRCLLAPVTASAVYKNELILVGKLCDFRISYTLARNIDGIRYMTCGKFIGTANIQNDISVLILHHRNGFAHGYLFICCIIACACRCCTSGKKQNGK